MVVPFFRGGEGDGTFNGFVLSKSVLLLTRDDFVKLSNLVLLKSGIAYSSNEVLVLNNTLP